MTNDQTEQLKANPETLRCYASRLKLSRLGKDYQAICPTHAEKNPSFQVFRNAEGFWMWKCQSNPACGSGNVLQFVQHHDKVDFKEAVKRVAAEVASEWSANRERVEQTFKDIGGPPKERVRFPLEQYAKLETALLKAPLAREWLLKERGITFSTAQQFHLGFRQDLGKIAHGSAVADKGWIAVPTIRGDDVVAIKYRSIVEKDFRRQPGMETCLYGEESIDLLEPIMVIEGEFDRIVLEQAGFRAVSIPNATTNLTPAMRDLLMGADQRILAGDSDEAGQQAMNRLWNDFQKDTYLLRWPDGCKDANDTFLKAAQGDVDKFRDIVSGLTREARSRPMEHFTQLQEVLLSANRTNLADHPDRLRFPWPAVDRMAILLPGSIMALSATSTKQGKTLFQMNFTMHAARKHREVVLNYQCELSDDEFGNIVAAHVLKKDRNHLTHEDYQEAAAITAGLRYYVGRNDKLTKVEDVLDLIEASIRRVGATVVVIDHLHFICRGAKDEVQSQALAMRRIKNMADQYGVKMVVIGQPRKADQVKKGKRIHITDMKGSETFTSDASAIYAIHRNEIKVKDPNNPPLDNYESKTEIHLLGARTKGDGAAYAELVFLGNLATFGTIAKDLPPEQQPFAEY